MQNDLISRSVLLEEIKKQDTSNLTKGLVLQFVEKQPTAYDAGKVETQYVIEKSYAKEQIVKALEDRIIEIKNHKDLGFNEGLDLAVRIVEQLLS